MRTTLVGLAGLLLVVGCGGDDLTVTGVVIEVVGDLTTTERFVVLTPDGERVELVPGSAARFHDGAPLSHLREHLVSGEPVTVRYEPADDGSKVVVEVDDA